MPEMNIIQAVNDALRLEMRRDPRVVVLGEDVGKFGGVFRATEGLHDEFGADRCIDTPLAEAGIIGTAIGMALYGLRPVPEIQFADFIYPAYDQIVNELAKFRYRSGGEYPAPVVIRTPDRRRHQGRALPLAVARGAVHPRPGPQGGLPVEPDRRQGPAVASAIRGEDPVIFMEPKRVYRAARGDVPEGEYTVPLGEAKVRARGRAGHRARLERDGAHRARGGRARARSEGFDPEVDRSAHAVAVRHRHHPEVGARRPGGW